MSEHHLPRQPAYQPEKFQINDPVVGKTFVVRDLTDEQLQRFMKNATEQHQQIAQQLQIMINQCTLAASMAAVLSYEIDRRAKSLQIVTSLNGLDRRS